MNAPLRFTGVVQMGRAQVLGVAGAAGVLVGLFSPLLVAVVAVTVAFVVAAALGAWRGGRESTGAGFSTPLPWTVFGVTTTLFWLIGRLGLILGLLAAVALVVLFFSLGGDAG